MMNNNNSKITKKQGINQKGRSGVDDEGKYRQIVKEKTSANQIEKSARCNFDDVWL